jgi:membrane-bound serine protease (ClpP class)
MRNFFCLIIVTLALSISSLVNAQDADSTKTINVFKFDIKKEIAPPIWRLTQKAFQQARDEGADLILIHMNTYGGMLESADSIRTIILQSEIPVYVFIDNNAASAGALISIACDSIYMRKGGSIGAATVVNQTGEAMPDKYQSYMRAMMRSTAEATGRDPDIAQAMVDPRISIASVIDSGKVLTFTTSEAIANGFCEGEAENINEVLKLSGIEDYEINEQHISALDKIISFLISPALSGILIMIIIGGIYFELQSPGIGFPSAAAIIAAMLYFAPLYLEGLAENWEIIIFIIGVVLVIIEIFAIPGFGIIGLSGIVLLITALTLSLLDNVGLDFSNVAMENIMKSFFLVLISICLSIVGSIYLTKKMLSSHIFGHLALEDVQLKTDGYSTSDKTYEIMLGKSGIAKTVLRPSGKVLIDGDVFDATAISGFIEKDGNILVKKYATGQLFVIKN